MTQPLTYNPHEIDEDTFLKISKSSFMLYNQCPRKYWWNYIGLPDVRPPPSDAMIRGSKIHRVMEPLIVAPNDPKVQKETIKVAKEEDVDKDMGFAVMSDLLVMLEEKIGKYKLLMAEQKITVYDERLDVYLLGAMDGLLQTEDGKIVLVELKTGNFTSGKMSRTRRELAFYTYMLEYTDFPRPTHFLYIAPDATDAKLLTTLEGQKKKVVGTGLTQGLFVMEPLSLRTVNAFMKAYEKTVADLKSKDFPIKWNDYFCTQYCDYVIQCEPETVGLCEDPTQIC